MHPIVSLIVPIYKIEEKLLRRGIDSLLNQTMKDIEILLIDDGSPDNAGIICDEYAKNDQRIRVFHNQNNGVSVARNCGIEHSLGKYIIFVDPDDYVQHDMCDKCVNAIAEANIDILIYGYSNSNDNFQNGSEKITIVDNVERKQMQQCIISQQSMKRGFILGSPWGKIFDGQFVREKLRFVPGLRRSQDRVFMVYAIEHTERIAFFDYVGYFYELTEESCGKKYNPDIVTILEAAGNEMTRFVSTYHVDDVDFQIALNQMWIAFSFDYMQLYFCNSKFIGNAKREIKRLFAMEPYKNAINSVNLNDFRKQIRIVYTLYKFKMYSLGCILCKKFNAPSK